MASIFTRKTGPLSDHGCIEDVPFDLRSLRVLIYDKEDESWGVNLKYRIAMALKETLEDIAGAVPLPFVDQRPVERPTEEPVVYEFRRIWEELRAIRLTQQQSVAPMLVSPPYPLTPPLNNKLVLDALRAAVGSERWASDLLLAQAGAEIWAGRPINAMRLFRDASSLELNESKGFVDRLRPILDGLRLAGVDPWR